MIAVKFDTKAFIAGLSDIEKRQFPFAVSQALNDTMFDVREGWMTEIQKVFDKPTALTINAVLYTKSTKQNLVAEVYIRNEASGGTPPARYLLPEVQGGVRPGKPFENLLRGAGILASDEYVVPARNFPLDAYGNVPATVIRTLLSDLQSLRDVNDRSSRESRAKRSRRKKIAARATYFESSPALSASQGRHQPLPRGIYQKTRFSSGRSTRMIFAIVKSAPKYRTRFDATKLAQTLFDKAFEPHFRTRLALAVISRRV